MTKWRKSNMRALENCEPKQVFYYFEELCKIPHGSGNTKHSSLFTADLGVYTFSLFFNLLADALHNTGVNDLDSRPFDSVQCLANWEKKKKKGTR